MGDLIDIQQRATRYRTMRDEAGATVVTVRREGVERAVRVDSRSRTIAAIAYPAWDPPAVGAGSVTRDEVERFVDSHGTFMRPATVALLARRFAEGGRAIDADHDRQPGAAMLEQTRIVQPGDAAFPEYAGSWAVALHVHRDDVWKRVERGGRGDSAGLAGLSIDVVTTFRDVDVEVEGLGVFTFGEFIDPEPLYLSMVGRPSTGEAFRAERAERTSEELHTMSDASNPTTPAESGSPAQDDDEKLWTRIVRMVRKDPARLARIERVQRAHMSLQECFQSMEANHMWNGVMSALWHHAWELFDDRELDEQGLRDALVDALHQAAELLEKKLSAEAVQTMRAERAEGGVSLVEAAVERVRRAGKVISSKNMKRLESARDAITEVIDSAGAEGAQRASGESGRPASVDGAVQGAEAAQRNGDTQEDPVNDDVKKAIDGISGTLEKLGSEIAAIRAERAVESGAAPKVESADEPPKDEALVAIRALSTKVDGLAADVAALRGRPAQRQGGEPEDTAGRQVRTEADGVVTIDGVSWDLGQFGV